MAGRGVRSRTAEPQSGPPERQEEKAAPISGSPAFTVHGCPLVVTWRKAMVTIRREPNTSRQTDTRTDQSWDLPSPAASLSSEF